MLKKICLVFFIYTSVAFSIIQDDINFFSETEKKELVKRIETLEEQFKINFIINISDKVIENKELINKKKTVIISLVKTSDTTIKLDLKFSNDIEVTQYKDDINNLLNNLELLMFSEEYQDFIYELTANISDIVNLINLEDKKIENRLQIIKVLKVILITSVAIIGIGILVLLWMILLKEIRNKNNSNMCLECNIRMRIFDKIEKKNKIIKIYKCSNCGRTKQLIVKKRY